jgi:acyl carrier protein
MEVREVVLSTFGNLEFEPDQIDDDTRIREDLAVDSTELTEIAIALEKTLGVVIDEGEFQQLETFGEIVKYVASARPQ